MEASVESVTKGEGYAVGSVEEIGEGYGFRKIRQAFEVKEFGINAIVMPPQFETGFHYHERQEELYFVHRGQIQITFGDGSQHILDEGGIARVDAATHRKIKNTGDSDALYVVVGAQGGYVGRDGVMPEGETRVKPDEGEPQG